MLLRIGEFYIGRLDGRGIHDERRTRDIVRAVADVEGNAALRERVGELRLRLIRPGHGVTHVVQDLRQAAHGASTDADEVDTPVFIISDLNRIHEESPVKIAQIPESPGSGGMQSPPPRIVIIYYTKFAPRESINLQKKLDFPGEA